MHILSTRKQPSGPADIITLSLIVFILGYQTRDVSSCHARNDAIIHYSVYEKQGNPYRISEVPGAKVYGDSVLLVPNDRLQGNNEKIRWNVTLSNYTICVNGIMGTVLNSNEGLWHLSFRSANFGHGQRIHPQGVVATDHWQITCTNNHPNVCMHSHGHANVCLDGTQGGQSINGIELTSSNSFWAIRELMVFDKHLDEEEIDELVHNMWEKSRFGECKTHNKLSRRRLNNLAALIPQFDFADQVPNITKIEDNIQEFSIAALIIVAIAVAITGVGTLKTFL